MIVFFILRVVRKVAVFIRVALGCAWLHFKPLSVSCRMDSDFYTGLRLTRDSVDHI